MTLAWLGLKSWVASPVPIEICPQLACFCLSRIHLSVVSDMGILTLYLSHIGLQQSLQHSWILQHQFSKTTVHLTTYIPPTSSLANLQQDAQRRMPLKRNLSSPLCSKYALVIHLLILFIVLYFQVATRNQSRFCHWFVWRIQSGWVSLYHLSWSNFKMEVMKVRKAQQYIQHPQALQQQTQLKPQCSVNHILLLWSQN